MKSFGPSLPPDMLRELLLQHKYTDAVRRVARGVAHNYNNIFTGLAGQMAILKHEHALLGDTGEKRGELIDGLLQRGIDQTAALSAFARNAETDQRIHSPLLLATKVLELLQCISRVHRFELVSHLRQEKILCNLRDILQLLFYLGENSVDATPGGGAIILEIGCADSCCAKPKAHLFFRFRDQGPGFAGGIPALVGDAFTTTKGDAPGRGLGLYAARILAEKHGGHLDISRREENETWACAIFPGYAEESVMTSLEKKEQERPRRGELGKQCFLVVEDDEAMRKLLLSRLQRRGHIVFCVDTCAEALEEYGLLNDIITIVLMDVGLRDDSGFECCRKMLSINPAARLIFMSGQTEAVPKEVAEHTIFLQKPFTMDQLEDAVHDVQI